MLTEIKIIKHNHTISEINLKGYKHYSTSTESTKGGTLLYMCC